MKIYRGIVLLCAAAALWHCQPSAGPSQSSDAAESAGLLVFEGQEFLRESATCQTDSNRCARISARYPLAVAGPQSVRQPINDSINAIVRLSLAVFALGPEEIPATLEEIAQQFLDEYEELTSEEAAFITPWSAELEGRVLFQSEKYITVELNTFSYAGGAHPNYFSFLLPFDAQSGKKLALEDLVRDTQALKPLAEMAFKEARGLRSGDDLGQEGFFWGEDFQFPENIAPVKEGLYFFYNPYEVAAYVYGPTEFTIPWEQLQPLLAPGVLD